MRHPDLKIEFANELEDWGKFYGPDGTLIFEGHPEDFYYQFAHFANKYGICEVVEEVGTDEDH